MTIRVYFIIARWSLALSTLDYIMTNILVNTFLYVDAPLDKYLVVERMHQMTYTFFFGPACSTWKFPGQGLNLRRSSDPSHCGDNARSLVHCTARERQHIHFQAFWFVFPNCSLERFHQFHFPQQCMTVPISLHPC